MADDLEQATLPRIPRKLQKKFSTTNQKVEEVKSETRDVKNALQEAKKDIIAEIKDAQKETKKDVKKERKSRATAKKTPKKNPAKKVKKAVAKKTAKKTVGIARSKTASANVSVNVTTPTGAKPVVAVKRTAPKAAVKPLAKKKPTVKKKAPQFVNERSFKALKNQTQSMEKIIKKIRADVERAKSKKELERLSKSIATVRKETNQKINSLKVTVKEAKDAALVASGVVEEVNHVKDMISQLELRILEKMEEKSNQPVNVTVTAPTPALVEGTESTVSSAVESKTSDKTEMTELERIMDEVKREAPRVADEVNHSLREVTRLESRLDELEKELKAYQKQPIAEASRLENRVKELEAEMTTTTHKHHSSEVISQIPTVSRMVLARVPNEQLAIRLVQLYFQEIASPNLKRQVDLDALVNAYVYALERLHSKKVKGMQENPMAVLEAPRTTLEREVIAESKTTN